MGANRHALRRDKKRREQENTLEWMNLIQEMVDDGDEEDSPVEDWEAAGFTIVDQNVLQYT